jgi:hypothetical protein
MTASECEQRLIDVRKRHQAGKLGPDDYDWLFIMAGKGCLYEAATEQYETEKRAAWLRIP